jgi:hypothetical protein
MTVGLATNPAEQQAIRDAWTWVRAHPNESARFAIGLMDVYSVVDIYEVVTRKELFTRRPLSKKEQALTATMILVPYVPTNFARGLRGLSGRASHTACEIIETTEEVAPIVKRIPNPGGRRGSEAHREVVASAEAYFRAKGWTVVSGGSEAERAIKVAGGKTRYADLVLEKNGKTLAIQVGRVTTKGQPVAREIRALKDIRGAGAYDHVHYLPYHPK